FRFPYHGLQIRSKRIVTLTFHALWLFCGVGSAVFAACAAQTWAGRASMAVGFVLMTATLITHPVVDEAWAGLLGASGAMLAGATLARSSDTRRWRSVAIDVASALCGGALASLWGHQLFTDGLPMVPAFGVAAALLLMTGWCAIRRPGFAPLALREESLLIV